MRRALLGILAIGVALLIGGTGTAMGVFLGYYLAGLVDVLTNGSDGLATITVLGVVLSGGTLSSLLGARAHGGITGAGRQEARDSNAPIPRGWRRLWREGVAFAAGYVLGLVGAILLAEAALVISRWPFSSGDLIPGFSDDEPVTSLVWIVSVLSSPTMGLLVTGGVRRRLGLAREKAAGPAPAGTGGAGSPAV